MDKRLSLLAALVLLASILVGCKGQSDAEKNNVDLKATPTNAPTSTTASGEKKPGPGSEMKTAP